MKKKGKTPTYAFTKNSDMLTFYYALLGYGVRHGLKTSEARQHACDAATLRYNITKGRLLNIISEQNYSLSVNSREFREKTSALIEELEHANREMADATAKNKKLIALLQQCLEDDS